MREHPVDSRAGRSEDFRGVERAERAVRDVGDAGGGSGRPAATVGGERVDWSDLQAALAEAGGAAALEEFVIDRALEREIKARGARIGSSDLEAERALAFTAMTQDAGVGSSAAGEVLDELRARRGLGPKRFERLLWRNAALRVLVRDGVTVSNDEIASGLAARFGERVEARIVVVRTEREAAAAREQLRPFVGDPTALTAQFAAIATRQSLDASASRGGLLDPFSLEDATYPLALRQALRGLGGDQRLTDTVAIEGGYALALLEGRSASPFTRRGGDEALMERQIRLRKERLAMDQLARRLLEASSVTVFDESLGWAWGRRGAR